MARLYYGNAHDNKKTKGPVIPGPGKVAWGAYLVTDDLVHKGVTRTAEKIKKKTEVSRKTQATIAMASTFAVSTLAIGFDDLKKLGWGVLVNSACFVAGKTAIDMLVENDGDIGKYRNGLIDKFFRGTRLIMVAFGTIKMGAAVLAFETIQKSEALNNVGNGLGWIGFGTALYLVSSGTDSFKRWTDALKKN